MKIAANLLRRYTEIPRETAELRRLLNDIGVEVKRVDSTDMGDVLNLELLANRGDHHCYAGVATEISGRTGNPVILPRLAEIDVGASPIELVLESDRCLVYTATLLERTDAEAEGLSADDLQTLLANDIHAVSAPVDASNLANLELGQPTHAFDLDKIVGPITIRLSRPGERCLPLFSEEKIVLPEHTLVIADDEKVLAVAGVIGCEESKTTESTTRLLLESATFDPIAVRKASRALDIHTDSSARFERGSDPIKPLVGAGRVTWLLEEHAGWKRVGTTGVVGDWKDPVRTVELDIPSAAAFVEYPLTEEEVRDRLSRYGFSVEEPKRGSHAVLVRVPPHRLWDVEYPADLHEELLKSIGFNETPTYTPSVDRGSQPSRAEVAKARAEDVLVGHGFYEVFTDGFYSRDFRDRAGIGVDHPLWHHVEIVNAVDRSYALLKNNGLLQAVESVATNLRMRQDEVKAYEWTRTFHLDDDAANEVCSERALLWAIVCGHDRRPDWTGTSRPADAIFLKGLMEELAVEVSVDLVLDASDEAHPLRDLLHPGRQARILCDGHVVGVLGEVHPSVCRAFRLKRARPAYLEIDASVLFRGGSRRTFADPSEHHPIVRNLAFTLPDGLPAGDIAQHLVAFGPPWLAAVDITDVFEHTDDDRPVRTITYELVYETGVDGRTAEEVNGASEVLIQAVEKHFGEAGVKLR